MSYIEGLPEIRMAKDLECDDFGIVPEQFYDVTAPSTAFAAAASLLQALEDEKAGP
ncbi:MAG TPA: hypothetical protein VE988_05300 [Gemmataceae bacterium]|nr:hypothetical protein [Gemmataceae bacterium]